MATFVRSLCRRSLLKRTSLPLWSQRCNVMNEEAAGENVPDELRTTVTMLNIEDKDSMFIDSYSPLGFRLSTGVQVVGPCIFFPKSILQWNIRSGRHITPESLCLFPLLEPKLDLLILGVGEKENLQYFTSETMKFLRTRRVNIEVLPTEQALPTFNFLNSEKRYIAAALVPPTYVSDATNEESYNMAFPDPNKSVADATLDWSEDSNFVFGKPKQEGDLPEVEGRKQIQQMSDYVSETVLGKSKRDKDDLRKQQLKEQLGEDGEDTEKSGKKK